MNLTQRYNAETLAAEQSRFMSKVYLWMAFGLFSTAYTSYVTANSGFLLSLIFNTPFAFLGLVILQFALVFGLMGMIQKMNSFVATVLFFAYAVVTGLTLSVIFLAYAHESILSAFAISGGTFAALSAYGYATKRDLAPMGTFLRMALIGLILVMLVNLFFHNSMMELVTSGAAVLIFAGLTAYDTQKLKNIYAAALPDNAETSQKITIMGALTLYLDFINLFLSILRLTGRRR